MQDERPLVTRMSTRVQALLPWIAVAGITISVALFAIDLPGHADRGSWGDLITIATRNWWPVVLILIIGFFARGRTVYHVVVGWFAGYFMSVAVAILILEPTGNWLGEDSRWQVSVLVPTVEELAKTLPIALAYLTVRRTAWMKPTITDFAVLGLAVGGGYAFHEDALFARVVSGGWHGWGILTPAIVQEPVFAVGHGVWTGLVGLGVGVALARRGRPLPWLAFLGAYAVATVDHALVNDQASRTALLDGRLPLYLLIVGIGAAMFVETRALVAASGSAGKFRADLSSALSLVANGSGGGNMPGRWQRFVFNVRMQVRQAWSLETELKTARMSMANGTNHSPPNSNRKIATGVALAAILAGLILFWPRDDSDPEVAPETTTTTTIEIPTTDSASSAGDDTNPGQSTFAFGDGLSIDSPLKLRWENETQRGLDDDLLMVIDGSRELMIQGSLLQYREGDLAVLCFDLETADVTCVGQPATGSLTASMGAEITNLPDLPGATSDTREIAGREALCVFTPLPDDSSILTCVDTGTGIALLTETTAPAFDGSTPTFTRRELVEWSTPGESDFELIPEAQAALEDLSG